MSDYFNFETPAQYMTHLSNVDELNRHSSVSDIYSVMLSQRTRLEDIQSKLSSVQHENVEFLAVNLELRGELSTT